MQVNRANLVRQNININNCNLRPQPHRTQQNNLIQEPPIQPNINNNNRNNRMAESAAVTHLSSEIQQFVNRKRLVLVKEI